VKVSVYSIILLGSNSLRYVTNLFIVVAVILVVYQHCP